ncbi:hypothetical protein M7I_3449 [Glarea lozoyensis 74030]|uniref:Uncharacterized protein n=1 Tax=Glarea lozoyensis (strain ATCC 74030 / MF5533) TaxID=1104152 RepID=H0ELI5_GLAL7|nr:hypothetical protein M7I_3449 [Glarea lozoyensis 74030]
MSAAALPKIKVIDTQNVNGNGQGSSVGIDSPSTITDGGQSGRPKSSTSSEDKQQENAHKTFTQWVKQRIQQYESYISSGATCDSH